MQLSDRQIVGFLTLRVYCELALAIVLALFFCPAAGASSVLIRAGRESAPTPATLATFGGRAEITVSQIKPGTPLTIMWLVDTFDSLSLDHAR